MKPCSKSVSQREPCPFFFFKEVFYTFIWTENENMALEIPLRKHNRQLLGNRKNSSVFI